MRLLVIDNYDSFTYNLVHLVRNITGEHPTVKRNDCFKLGDVVNYDKIMLSPGPGIPSEAGLLMDLIHEYGTHKSILGICLGHQAIGSYYGAQLTNMQQVVHGKESLIKQLQAEPLFADIPERFTAGRYHSWVVSKDVLPRCLEVTAEDELGEIMALRHRTYDVRGVQFHPESIMTKHGAQIIANWLKQ